MCFSNVWCAVVNWVKTQTRPHCCAFPCTRGATGKRAKMVTAHYGFKAVKHSPAFTSKVVPHSPGSLFCNIKVPVTNRSEKGSKESSIHQKNLCNDLAESEVAIAEVLG